jgi:hypothetical protein
MGPHGKSKVKPRPEPPAGLVARLRVYRQYALRYWARTPLKHKLAIATMSVVFLVGFITVLEKIQGSLPDLSQITQPKKSGNVKNYEVANVRDAKFPYLVPGKNAAWEYDEKTIAYDKAKDVVKYGVRLNNSQANVTFSQQKFPKDLESPKSPKFMAFVNDSNPTRSQDTGRGTVYFLSSLENGVETTKGADTIIFVTDDVLMFAKAGRIVGYDGWSQLLATMRPR